MAGSKVVALSGGVGGAKLAFGLSQILSGGQLSVVANTGDDFEHLGLYVCPDVDTLTYTLAGINNPDTGWGRASETWSFMVALEEIGAPDWFRLGDKDLALNVYRTNELRNGKSLSEVTTLVARRLGISDSVIPMTDDCVRTMIDTDSGTLAFQEYFVRQRCRPTVREISFHGAENARPSPDFEALLVDGNVDAWVLCPSNPYLSIDPILSIPGIRQAIAKHEAPVVAVSPIISGKSVKGPTSKIMEQLGRRSDSITVASHYQGLIDGIVIDKQDEDLASEIAADGVQVHVSNTLMNSTRSRVSLASAVLSFARQLTAKKTNRKIGG